MSLEADCIFCKIIGGSIPCHRIFEDDQVMAFLDVGPLARGHTLVIPKIHAVTLETLPPEYAAACLRIVPAVAHAVMTEVGDEAAGWNLLQNNGPVAGQAVGHVHFHIIPRKPNDGLGFRWLPGKLDQEEAQVLAENIKSWL